MMNTRSLPVLIAAAAAASLAAVPSLAAETESLFGPMDQPGWAAFFGRLHMVVLHLPIGILMGAFVIELLGLFRRSRGYDVAAAWLLVFGAISAWVACTTGWLLEETDSNIAAASATFGWHKWLGISLAIVATLAAVLKVVAVRKQWKPAADDSGYGQHAGGPALTLARLGLVAIMVMLPVTGHLGGNMVHQPDFLSERAPFNIPDWAVYWPEKSEAAVPDHAHADDGDPTLINASLQSWNTSIQPVLDAKCVECHGITKQKGDYRLDTLAYAIQEGESPYTPGFSDPPKANIVPGSRVLSELYYRVAIPDSHTDFMPTKGDAMTAVEVELLGKWIDEFNGNLDGTPAPTGEGSDTPVASGGERNKPDQPAAPTYDPMVERQIEQVGANVQPVSQEQDAHLMRVTYAFRSEAFQPGSLKVLADAAGSVAQLELQGTAVSDADLADLKAMPNLTDLNLKDTAITDQGLANLPEMPALERINLFGTKITDAGLESLARHTGLKKVYVTGTDVSKEAVDKLQAALPEGAEVFSDHQFSAGFDLSGGTADASAPDQATEPINTKCPVSGADVNAQFTSVYEGKTVAFCCGDCKKKFDADPASFADKLPAEEPAPAPDANAAAPVNAKCPVSDAAINAEFTSVYEGKTVAFCCGNCKKKFDENPAPFADKLQ